MEEITSEPHAPEVTNVEFSLDPQDRQLLQDFKAVFEAGFQRLGFSLSGPSGSEENVATGLLTIAESIDKLSESVRQLGNSIKKNHESSRGV